jgi:hypothetical protein
MATVLVDKEDFFWESCLILATYSNTLSKSGDFYLFFFLKIWRLKKKKVPLLDSPAPFFFLVAKWRKFATKTNPKGVRCGTYGTEANTRGGVESEKIKCVGKKGEKKQ